MIERLHLQNLKCFESLRLDLAPLTLLTGFNAAGKSTSLQSLLLLAQTLRSQRGTSELRLNGPLAALGTPADVLNSAGGANGLALGVANDDVELLWHFALEEENRRSLRVSHLDVTGEGATRFAASDLEGLEPRSAAKPVGELLRVLQKTVFLSAARQVETEVFPVPMDLAVRMGDIGVIGQYAAWWLYSEGDSFVQAERKHPDAKEANTIRQQVNAWASQLFPGAALNALQVPRTNLMQLQLRSGPTVDWSSPANIGYGVSYAFPILVAGLCSRGDHPFVVDSPEAHLHPQGQSQIGRFLAQMAAAGSQILVETHSDHLLNGVRLAVRNSVIRPEDVAIYFFAPSAAAHVTRLSVDKHGTISDWPEGFFDQSEKDLASLAGWTA